jgi:predicted lipoprotein
MKISKIAKIASLCAAITFLSACTIVPIDSDTENASTSTISSGEKATDVAAYIDEKWESVLVPEIDERKAELSELVAAAGGNWDGVGEEFGLKKGEIGAKYNFIVSGTGTVQEVNTESKAGLLIVALSDGTTVQIAIGPVLKGTAIRDALENVNFNEFVNQMDYAKLASELNKFCNAPIGETVDFAALQGKTIEFTGCFTQPEGDVIDIMPVALEVK